MLDDNAFSIKEQRKTFVGFHIPKNISLKRHFIQHKPLISKQCHSYIFMRVTQLFVFLKLPKYIKKTKQLWDICKQCSYSKPI